MWEQIDIKVLWLCFMPYIMQSLDKRGIIEYLAKFRRLTL